MNDMLLAGDDRAIHGFADRLNFRTKLVRPSFIRLSGVSSKGFPTGLAAMAEESAVDVLLLPPDLSLRRFRVACFDMDSTLIESECIDEMAAFAGAGERISRITRRAMEGLIPFDESLRQRVAALAGGDGANDLQMIAAAGFGFAYHGKPVVMREAPRGVRFGDFSVLKHCFLEAWA